MRARGTMRANVVGDRIDRLDAVVDEEHLAAAIELARDALVDQAVVPRLDEGEHGRPVARRRLHQRHVAQAGERQVQRARNRRRGEREHVGLELELLEPLLVLHAEAMLLVDDDEAEVRELDVGAEQPVRADDDVDLLRLRARRATAACSFARLEAAHRARRDREIGEPLARRCARAGRRESSSARARRPGVRDCTALNAARTAISVLP